MPKNQSAIKYLTQYRWFILVAAIAGAAIFTTTQINKDGDIPEDAFYQTSEGIVKCPGVTPRNTFKLNGKT
jgi:hypothetical protein